MNVMVLEHFSILSINTINVIGSQNIFLKGKSTVNLLIYPKWTVKVIILNLSANTNPCNIKMQVKIGSLLKNIQCYQNPIIMTEEETG